MTRMAAVPFLFCTFFSMLSFAADKAADKPSAKPAGPRDLPSLAARAEAIVLARVESISPKPSETNGAVSLAIEHDYKGPLAGGRDYIWISGQDLPKAEVGAQLWLLCLERDGDGFWHVLKGEHSPSMVDGPNAAPVKTAAESAYLLGRAPDERFGNDELSLWVHKAGKGSKRARNEAFSKLLEAGPRARIHLTSAETSNDPEIANIARRLLPLSNGGPAAAGISLLAEPFRFALADGEKRNVTIHYANLTDRDIRLVTGTSTWGENVLAAAAYDVRKLDKDSDALASTELLKAQLPENYAKPLQEGASPLPLVRVVPSFGTLPVVLQLELEKTEVAGVTRRRLKFPHGSIDLPGDGAGRFSVKARFECAGPRPDQKQLIASNFWQGGRLVSNEFVITIR